MATGTLTRESLQDMDGSFAGKILLPGERRLRRGAHTVQLDDRQAARGDRAMHFP